jgi:hypothetical protein
MKVAAMKVKNAIAYATVYFRERNLRKAREKGIISMCE